MGASKGIGRAAAMALAQQGRALTLVARDITKLQAAAEEPREAGAPEVHVLAADFDARKDAIRRIARHVEAHPVHILVVNTGGPPGGALLASTEEMFLHAYGRHQLAAHGVLQTVLPGMRDAEWGRVVCVLSTSVREPIAGLGVSNTIRAGMASWAKTLSRELPPGITINCVLPGFTATDRLQSLAESRAGEQSANDIMEAWAAASPEARLGRPEELGAAIAWLCSDEASFVRGVVLPVDGGRLHSI